MFIEIILWLIACNLCLECTNNNYESKSEWDKYYSNTYNILGLEGELTKGGLRAAAEDIVFIYKLREAGMIERSTRKEE